MAELQKINLLNKGDMVRDVLICCLRQLPGGCVCVCWGVRRLYPTSSKLPIRPAKITKLPHLPITLISAHQMVDPPDRTKEILFHESSTGDRA